MPEKKKKCRTRKEIIALLNELGYDLEEKKSKNFSPARLSDFERIAYDGEY